jgi:hypothetical protein
MFDVVCPECFATYKIQENLRGRRGHCKQCGARFQLVPEAGDAPDADLPESARPLRPKKRPEPEAEAPIDPVDPGPAKPRPLSKRLKKWYKRSWLSNPSTGGWQIAAGYAGIGVLILMISLFSWLRHLQGMASEDTRSSYKTVYTESSSNVSHLGMTSAFCLGALFCLPIPYGLWIGSHIGRYAWLFARGVLYIAWVCILPGALSGSSQLLVVLLIGLLVMTAISNLVGCLLLTTWEGSVGRMLFAGALIALTELVAIILFLTTGFPSQKA